MKNFLKVASLTLATLTTALIIAEVIKESTENKSSYDGYWD